MRFPGVVGFRLNPDNPDRASEAQLYIPRARKTLGKLLEKMKIGNIKADKYSEQLPDGAVITAWSMFGNHVVRIDTPPSGEGIVFPFSAGIISIPVSDSCTSGWGRPFTEENLPLGTCTGDYPNVLAVVESGTLDIVLERSITALLWGTTGGNSSPVDSEVEYWTISWSGGGVYHKGTHVHQMLFTGMSACIMNDNVGNKHVLSVGKSSSLSRIYVGETELVPGELSTPTNQVGTWTTFKPDPGEDTFGLETIELQRNGSATGSFLYGKTFVEGAYTWDRLSWSMNIEYDEVADEFSYSFTTNIVDGAFPPITYTTETTGSEVMRWKCSRIAFCCCSSAYVILTRQTNLTTGVDFVPSQPIYSSNGTELKVSEVITDQEVESGFSVVEDVWSGTSYSDSYDRTEIKLSYGPYIFSIYKRNEVTSSYGIQDVILAYEYCLISTISQSVSSATIYIDPSHSDLFYVIQHCTSHTANAPSTEQLKNGLTTNNTWSMCLSDTEDLEYYVTTFDKIIAVAHGVEYVIGYNNFNTAKAVITVEDFRTRYDTGISFQISCNGEGCSDSSPCPPADAYPDGCEPGTKYYVNNTFSGTSGGSIEIPDLLTIEKISVTRCAWGAILASFTWQELVSSTSETNTFNYKSSFWSYMTTKGESQGPEVFYEIAGEDARFNNIGLW